MGSGRIAVLVGRQHAAAAQAVEQGEPTAEHLFRHAGQSANIDDPLHPGPG
jgi:hypothetical protein